MSGVVVGVRIKCIELNRTARAICVAYMGKDMWLPLSQVKSITTSEDGYTHLSLPVWLLLSATRGEKAQRAKTMQQRRNKRIHDPEWLKTIR